MCARSVTRLRPTLCNPMDCSLPGSPVYGVFLERILEWVAISSSNNSWHILPNFSPEHTVTDLVVLVVQSYQTLCDPMNCSPPGSSVHGFSEASILEWAASSSSKGSSWFRDWTHISCIGSGFFTTEPQCDLFIFNLLSLCLMPCARSHGAKTS